MQLRSRRAIVAMFGAVLLTPVAGCASQPPVESPQAAPAKAGPSPAPATAAPAPATKAAPQVKRGGVLRVGNYTEPPSLDPHKGVNISTAQYMGLVYESLLELDSKDVVVPGLAESWQATDPKTYAFKLRSGVKFHNGRALSSADVKYSIDRIRDPKTESPRASYFTAVQAIETPDPQTVVFRLEYPFAPLLNFLAQGWIAVVPKEVAEGGLDKGGVGTGPFKFQEWNPRQYVKLVRNPDYWDKDKPYLDGVEFAFIPDENARLAALQSGRIDFDNLSSTANLPNLKRDKQFTVMEGPKGDYQYLALNPTLPPFDDVRVRQAISLAIDRQQIVDLSLDGSGVASLGGAIPPSHWAASPQPIIQRNLDQAKALLAQAKFTGPFSFKIMVIGTAQRHVRGAQVVAQNLKPLGFDAEAELVDVAVSFSRQASGKYDALIHAHSGLVDPDDFLWQRLHSTGARNVPKWQDPRMDDLLERGRATLDPAERKKIYNEAERYGALNGPTVFLNNAVQDITMASYVKGFEMRSDGQLTAFRKVWLDK